MDAGEGRWTVISPPASLDACREVRRELPAVVVCEELSTIGPGILELAERIARRGYAVYVPVLFGDERENPNGFFVQTRGLTFAAGRPSWRANAEVSERRIVHELAEFCRRITERHGGRPIGVIGLCLTGSFPLELLAEQPPLRIAAPVLSQPSIPIVPNNFCERQSVGMPETKLQEVAAAIKARGLQVLGFRFELDPISPPERFAHLKAVLGATFLDATLPAFDYVYRDGCPPSAHAVLTDGFMPWEKGTVETRGHFAWKQLAWFLDARLKGLGGDVPRYRPRVRRAPADPDEAPFSNVHGGRSQCHDEGR